MSLVQKANNYAQINRKYFLKKIKTFGVDIEHSTSFEKCDGIYKKYKNEWCKFDNIINFGYLFEKKNKLYNDLKYQIQYVSDEDKFKNIYRDYLGQIYKEIFEEIPEKLSLIEKVSNMNAHVLNLYKCVVERIKYHYWCKKHHIKYDINNHENEILFSIYMYNRIVDIQFLLNSFRDKYLEFKEKLHNERKNIEEREKRFDDLSNESSKLSEPYKLNKKREKRHKSKKLV